MSSSEAAMETRQNVSVAASGTRDIPTSNPHSGSCVVCAKAKSKCVRRPGRDTCERCTRLRKDCHIREPLKRKRNATKTTRSDQLKHLERKLEDIAQTLVLQQVHGSTATADSEPNSRMHPVAFPLNRTVEDSRQPSPQRDPERSTTSNHYDASVQDNTGRTNISEYNETSLSMHETEVLYDRFRRRMAPCMPFVVIPSGTNASNLAKSKPFLLQVITTMTFFHDTRRQQIMVKNLMHQISERMLINGEKSMDLLQGLLIFLTWYNPHLFVPQNHTNLLHLTMALTVDMNIGRAPGSCEKAAMEAAEKAHGIPQPVKPISNDERRAVLGIYYLTSQIFTSFRKVDTLNWTPWLTDCLDALAQAREYESDTFLAQLVHAQRIMHEVMSIKYDHAPVQFYAKSFVSDLDKFGVPIGDETMATVVRLQHACTRTAIWERSFVSPTDDKVKENDVRQRLDGMWQCIEAAKAYIDVYMEMPTEDSLVVQFGVFAQFAYILVVVIRASSIKMNGWDIKALREYVDFSTIMEEASRRYDTVSETRPDGLQLANDAFTKWSAKIRWVKSFYDTILLSAMSNAPGNRDVTNLATGQTEQPTLVVESQVQGLTALDIPIDQSLNSFESFEDNIWNGFNNLPQLPEDLCVGLNGLYGR